MTIADRHQLKHRAYLLVFRAKRVAAAVYVKSGPIPDNATVEYLAALDDFRVAVTDFNNAALNYQRELPLV